MKKLLSIVLVIGMLMSVMSMSVSAADDATPLTEEETAFLMMRRADIDKDGAYSTKDASMLLRAAAGIIESNDEYDLNLDGDVSLDDAQKMLRISANLDSLASKEVLFNIFDTKLDSVKKVKPGFDKAVTMVCPSIKVTTTGAPDDRLNVSNMEYKNYVNTLVNVMNSFPYNTMLDDEMKKELELMKKSAVEVYQPQTETKSVAATSNSHYTNFPVDNLGWSCNLNLDEVNTISQTVADGAIQLTITLGEYTYEKTKTPYPTGSAGFSERQKLPYGKIFNIPALDETDGSVVNKMVFKNGKVIVKLDIETGDVVGVDYSYSYTSSITSPKAENSDLVMKTVTTSNVSENYEMYTK